MTLANKVTLSRLLLVPVFVAAAWSTRPDLLGYSGRLAALAVFLLAAGGDFLDGYLARTRGERTSWGVLLDPLADKALLLTACLVLTSPLIWQEGPNLAWWVAAIVITRDLLLLGGYGLVRFLTGPFDPNPTLTGKLTTVVQMVTVLAFVIGPPVPEKVLWSLGLFTAIVTAVSGLHYLLIGVQRFSPRAAREA